MMSRKNKRYKGSYTFGVRQQSGLVNQQTHYEIQGRANVMSDNTLAIKGALQHSML